MRARHRIDPYHPDTLYVVGIKDPANGEEYIKIGRTIRSLEKRFSGSQYRLLNITPIWLVQSTHAVVERIETELKQLRLDGHHEFRPFRPSAQIDGYTEVFHGSSLGRICEYIDDCISPDSD